MRTRDRILDAALHVMRSRGLARTTTKEIARAAELSEAALYKHFRDKTDLFVAVLSERMPSNLRPLLTELPGRAAAADLRANLLELASTAVAFYHQTFPIAASLFAEPRLLDAHRTALRERGAGPQYVTDACAAYLADEQRLGRVRADADVRAAAALFIGACFQHAFLGHFVEQPPRDEFAAAIVDTLVAGLAPA